MDETAEGLWGLNGPVVWPDAVVKKSAGRRRVVTQERARHLGRGKAKDRGAVGRRVDQTLCNRVPELKDHVLCRHDELSGDKDGCALDVNSAAIIRRDHHGVRRDHAVDGCRDERRLLVVVSHQRKSISGRPASLRGLFYLAKQANV